MSVIGLFEFLGGAVILCGATCFVYQWLKQNLLSPDTDDPWARLACAFISALVGISALLLSAMVLMMFLSMVFPGSIR